MEDPIIEVRGLSKHFGNVIANHNIDMQIKRGTIHSIIGENGAGKSTLLHMIAGIFQPTTGEIIVNNKSVSFKDPNDATKEGIGMVHQEFMLFPDLTVLENLMIGFEETKNGMFLNKNKAKKDIEEICTKYSFSIPLNKKISELPVSILQQVEIVKVLYKGADIIILDEPTSVLTPQGIEGLFEAIRYLKDSGKTIIMITHKLQEVMQISDYITVLKDGEVTGNLTPGDADEKILANLMVGRDVIFKTNKVDKKIGDEVLVVKDLKVLNDDGISKVKNIGFEVKQGEILGIAGVAGSGQGELIEAIFGLRKIDSGKVIYKGKDKTSFSPKENREHKIGYVPADRMATGCSRDSTIIENSIMGYHVAHKFKNPYLVNKSESESFTSNIVETFKVKTDSIFTNIGNLSGGNIQKVIVGREFLQDNDLLIIEDPTRGIDVGAIEFIWQEIINITQKGVSVLLVSHELGEVMELSDRILVMYDGKITASLSNCGELTEEEIGYYMLGGSNREEAI